MRANQEGSFGFVVYFSNETHFGMRSIHMAFHSFDDKHEVRAWQQTQKVYRAYSFDMSQPKLSPLSRKHHTTNLEVVK